MGGEYVFHHGRQLEVYPGGAVAAIPGDGAMGA